jgi:hypothetical protein
LSCRPSAGTVISRSDIMNQQLSRKSQRSPCQWRADVHRHLLGAGSASVRISSHRPMGGRCDG